MSDALLFWVVTHVALPLCVVCLLLFVCEPLISWWKWGRK